MATILNIETSTDVCSVALSQDGEVLDHHENYDGQSHATLLGAFVDDALRYVSSRGLKVDSVAVSVGPGSYTGLRIGMGLAKGLAFGMNVPLIGVSTLRLLAVSAMFNHMIDDGSLYVPMIDARRMEVYTAVYNAALEAVVEPRSMILEPGCFSDLLGDNKLVFMGNGSDKAQPLVDHANALFLPGIKPVALDMVALSELAFRRGEFIDVAYSTPSYLKQYNAAKPHNKVLDRLKSQSNQ